ncbi:ribonuclease domain-containing protein [Gordonia sp. (in: high G+C Gram-positive bacteria)]|uniref:ribonuclease domain-containing protein n=1 Tax=Gordonia sp. (in: high G+C Gram-positive bacteria) TaxID=84139 RepID=UPI003C78B899
MSNSNPTDADGAPDLTKRRTFAAILAVVLLLAVVALTWWIDGRDGPDSEAATSTTSASSAAPAPAGAATPKPTRPATASKAPKKTSSTATPAPSKQIPARVLNTLALVDAGRWPEAANAPGTRGGDTFRNNERNLPVKDSSGRRITYREWDVNPKQRGRGRDAERIVTSSDGSAWYTKDHYKSFILIRGPAA